LEVNTCKSSSDLGGRKEIDSANLPKEGGKKKELKGSPTNVGDRKLGEKQLLQGIQSRKKGGRKINKGILLLYTKNEAFSPNRIGD